MRRAVAMLAREWEEMGAVKTTAEEVDVTGWEQAPASDYIESAEPCRE